MDCRSCKYFCKIIDGHVVNDCERPKTNPYKKDAEILCDNYYPPIDTIYYGGTISVWSKEQKKFIEKI